MALIPENWEETFFNQIGGNRDTASLVLDWIKNNPQFQADPTASPLFQQIYQPLNKIRQDQLTDDAENVLGWIPGVSNIPTLAGLQAQGVDTSMFPAGAQDAPLFSNPGSLYDSFAARGGSQALAGPYMAALGAALGDYRAQRSNVAGQSMLDALGLAEQSENQQFNQAINLAGGYAGLPTVGSPPVLPEESEGPGFEFPNPFANRPSVGGDSGSGWTAAIPGVAGTLLGAWIQSGFKNPFGGGGGSRPGTMPLDTNIPDLTLGGGTPSPWGVPQDQFNLSTPAPSDWWNPGEFSL